jgi:hypothetical protein
MPTDPLEIFATELSLRLEQFGFKKKPLDIERNGPEKHCHSACNIDPLSRGIGVQNWL